MIIWVAEPDWGSVLCAVWKSPCGPLGWPPQEPIGRLFWPLAMAPAHWWAISLFELKNGFAVALTNLLNQCALGLELLYVHCGSYEEYCI